MCVCVEGVLSVEISMVTGCTKFREVVLTGSIAHFSQVIVECFKKTQKMEK